MTRSRKIRMFFLGVVLGAFLATVVLPGPGIVSLLIVATVGAAAQVHP